MKRPKVKGCYECSRRRIDCDRAEPECQKCQMKELKCSGLGIRYRFNDIQGPKRRITQHGASCAKQPFHMGRSVLSDKSLYPGVSVFNTHQRISSDRNIIASCPDVQTSLSSENQYCPLYSGSNDDYSSAIYNENKESSKFGPQRHDSSQAQNPILQTLDHLDAPTRSLLSYFSLHVASKMAVIDQGFNGFRDLVLPLAETNLLVRRAVLVASTQHLSLRTGGMLMPTKRLYSDVIQSLVAQSQLSSGALPQYETSLVAILLLLTTEMIIGGERFGLIYEALKRLLCACSNKFKFADTDLGKFLEMQTCRFQLFAESLLSEVDGAHFLTSQAEKCLEFVNFCLLLHPEHVDVIIHLRDMIQQACDIYVHRAFNNPPISSTIHLVERFRLTAEKIKQKELGQQVLTWSYFVAAAESSNLEHRKYFVERINNLYHSTGFQNTIRGLGQLERIWSMQSTTRWTTLLGGPAQVLIM